MSACRQRVNIVAYIFKLIFMICFKCLMHPLLSFRYVRLLYISDLVECYEIYKFAKTKVYFKKKQNVLSQ